MKRLLCLCLCAISGSAGFSQVRFNSIFETGVSLPVGNKTGTYNANGISLGNHFDLNFGSGRFTWGVGAYVGHTSGLGVSDQFKKDGLAIASRYQLSASQLNFSSSAFHSTQFLLGPVVGIGAGNFNLRLSAKGGIGINEPGRYAVTYREGGLTEQKIYINNSSENKNGLAYDLGAGIVYNMSENLGIQLGVSYNNTRTDQVSYSYEREKGTAPSYYTANNSFVRASVGVVLGFNSLCGGGSSSRAINTSRSNVKSPSRAETARVNSARDAGSGMATGRRMHKPMTITQELGKTVADPEDTLATREAGSGMATGRRQYQPVIIRKEMATDEEAPASREAGSGLATGRRQYQPVIIRKEMATDEEAPASREAGSGLATGRRQHSVLLIETEDATYRIVHRDIATRNLMKGQNNNTVRSNRGGMVTVTFDSNGDENEIAIDEPGMPRAVIVTPRDAASGQATGKRMATVSNPLYESSGNSGENPLFEGKGIQEKGIKRSAAEKGIQENGISSDKGINQAGVQKTVNTSRGNIKRVQNINCKGDDCDVEIVFEVDGEEYSVVLKGSSKTKRRVEVLKSN